MNAVEQARTLVRQTIAPEVRGWEASGRYPRSVAAASGLTGLFCPAEAGGLALSFGEGMAVFEELGRGDAAFAFSLSMHNAVAAAVATAAPPDVAQHWARPLAEGSALGGFSLTEPLAGSDATAITTRAPGRRRLAGRRPQGVGVTGWRGRSVPRGLQDV